MSRPFNREALTSHASEGIRAPIGIGAMVWRYTVLVPLNESSAGEESRQVATDDDIEDLRGMLSGHFQGLTIALMSTGYGLRAGEIEMNTHCPMIAYAAIMTATENYFTALRKELQEALDQELVLVERQEVWLQ